MRAEIVSVGTELLLGQIVDTNAARLCQELSGLGIAVYRRTTVGDNHDRLLTALQAALAENDIVITIGGLGPTMDDITRDVLAEAMGDTLQRDESIAQGLRALFERRGIPILESNLRQAMAPTRGRTIPNPNGTAPGLIFENRGKVAVALPGPPGEFNPMLTDHVAPYLRGLTGGQGVIRSRVLRVCGMGESMVEDRVKDLMTDDNPTVAPYAKTGEVHLRVTAHSATVEEAERLIESKVAALAERLGDHLYAYDDEPLEVAVVRLASERNATISTAESCTGGRLAGRITDVAGSSQVFMGAAVTYGNQAKTDLVGVPTELLARFGAVSAQVAEAMARGVRERFSTKLAVGITGIAGPGGGTAQKPVGLVYISLAHAGGCEVEEHRFLGGREDVRHRATQTALTMLRDHLLKTAE